MSLRLFLFTLLLICGSKGSNPDNVSIVSDGSRLSFIPPGKYFASRERIGVKISVDRESEFLFSIVYLRPPWRTGDVEGDEESFPRLDYPFAYTMDENYSIAISNKDAMDEIITTLADLDFAESELIKEPFQYLAPVKAIRMGSVVLSQQATFSNEKLDEFLCHTHYLKHILGNTYIVRLISKTEVFVGVAVTADAESSSEVLTSAILAYKFEDSRTIRAVLKVDTNLPDFSFVKRMFVIASGLDLNGSIKFEVAPDFSTISLGRLVLQVDSNEVPASVFQDDPSHVTSDEEVFL
jgi:hypothetical protein